MPDAQLDEQSLFHVATQISSPEARAEYLAQVCGDDMAKFDRLNALLRVHDQQSEFLESPPPGLDVTADLSESREDDSGTMVGPYKLLQQIGEGGFGVVYMAEQTVPIRRKVAVKIIKPGMDSKEVIARFETERQAAALMDHANIARILDAGTTDAGRPYFVMELVKGVTVTEYCDTNNLATQQRLELFAAICRAVQHAHQKGVIHRDLKPSNILVTLHDGQPVPKIIDFGVAKALCFQLTEKTLFTRYGQVIGTPQYMSPEQAEMSGLDIDTRSDIYSLGVLLYELLTGRTPFESDELKGRGLDEMRRLIRKKEPVMPSHMIRTLDADTATAVANHRSSKPATLSRLVQGELDWIVMKALDKDRNRRYETANGLAEDVERYLTDDAVLAGPPSMTYQLWKTFKRHRTACISAAAVSLALVVGLIVSLVATRFAVAAGHDADMQREIAKEKTAIAERETERARHLTRETEKQKQLAIKQGQQARVEASNANQTLGLVLDILSKAKVNPRTGKPYTVREALDDLANNLQAETRVPLNAAAVLHLAIGKAYFRAARHVPTNAEQSRKHLEKAIALAEKEFGSESLLVAKSLRYLGALERTRDKLLRAAEIERKLHADQELSKTLTLLGTLMHRLDKLDEAEKHLREACKLFQPNDPTVALEEIPFLPLAHVLREQGHAKNADEYRSKAIAVSKTLFGTDMFPWKNQQLTFSYAKRHLAHEYVNLILEDLRGANADPEFVLQVARAFRHVANYGAAERRMLAALKTLEDGHDLVMQAAFLSDLASVHCDAHDFVGAEVLQRLALKAWDASDVPDPNLFLWHHVQLGMILMHLGRTDETKRDEAKQVFVWIENETKRYNEKRTVFLDSRSNEHMLLAARLNSGEPVTPTEYLKTFDEDSKTWQREYDLATLGDIYQKNGLDDEAIATLETSARMRNRIGRDECCFELLEPDLLNLYIKHDQLPRAQKFFTELVAARDQWLPMNHPNRAFMRILLARVLILQKSNLDRARTLLLEARRILSKHNMVPEEPKQEVADLLAQIDQVRDGK